MSTKAPKTVNNVLTVLNVLLKKAVEWDVIERMPCASSCCPFRRPSMSFYDFDEYERLVGRRSHRFDPNELLVVLLGGEAGLRCGEMIALEWRDVDLGQAANLRRSGRTGTATSRHRKAGGSGTCR